MSAKKVNEALINSAIRRVARRDGLTGDMKSFRSAVHQQVRLELGFLFWLQVVLLIIRLVQIFWHSQEAADMRKGRR